MANPFYPPKSARQPGTGGGDLGANYSLDEPGYASPPAAHAQRPVFDPHRQRSYEDAAAQPRRGEYGYDNARGADDSPYESGQAGYAYPQQQQHQSYYPNNMPYEDPYGPTQGGLAPPAAFGASAPSLDEAPSRPGTPGIYPDRAPKLEKLSAAQRKIASSFPKDLDKNGGSMWKDMISTAKDWRSYVKWKYTHWYVGLIICIVLIALFSYYHRQIVDWLTPMSLKIKDLHW